MIIGYIYSEKCNENAEKKRLINFEFWKNKIEGTPILKLAKIKR